MILQRIFLLLTVTVTVVGSLLFSSQTSANTSFAEWPLRAKGEVRYLKMIKVYDASLFSPQAVSANNILNPTVSKCLQLDYAVSLSVDKFRLATDKILQRQHSVAFLEKIKAPLSALQASYKAVDAGDYYRLCYNGKTQKIRLDLNQIKLIEIRSADLAKAYMGIWLSSNQPISWPLYLRFFPKNAK